MKRDVNLTWNVCNNAARKKWKEFRGYIQKSDLNKITQGASKELQIIQGASYELLTRLRNTRKSLRFRGEKIFQVLEKSRTLTMKRPNPGRTSMEMI